MLGLDIAPDNEYVSACKKKIVIPLDQIYKVRSISKGVFHFVELGQNLDTSNYRRSLEIKNCNLQNKNFNFYL